MRSDHPLLEQRHVIKWTLPMERSMSGMALNGRREHCLKRTSN